MIYGLPSYAPSVSYKTKEEKVGEERVEEKRGRRRRGGMMDKSEIEG